MLSQREQILRECEARLSTHLQLVPRRNPVVPPTPEDMPYIALYELNDVVKETKERPHGQLIHQTRELTLVVEFYFVGSSEDNVTYEFSEEYPKLRAALLKEQDGLSLSSLSGLCVNIKELAATKIFRPVTGQAVIGIGVSFLITYIETL